MVNPDNVPANVTMATNEFELVRDRNHLMSLRGAWNDLWARSHGDYPLSFASCLASWDLIHAPQKRQLRCAVMRTADRVVAILPMVTYRRGLWRVASTLGPEAAEGCDILQADGAAPEIAPALLAFFMARVRPDVVALPYVRSGSGLDHAVRAGAANHVVTQTDSTPYARLRAETDWVEYERSLGRNAQQQTARKQRRMAEEGVVTFEVRDGESDAAIDWLLDEKAKWGLKVEKTGSWLFSARYRAWLKRYADEGHRVLTFILRLDGKPAAAKVIVVGPTLCTLVIAAYDETLARFSPGNILDSYWIRHVFDHGRDPQGRRLDISFGGGVERYKLHWGRGVTVPTTTYKLIGTRWGAAPYAAKALARSLSTVLSQRRRHEHAGAAKPEPAHFEPI